MKAFRQPKPVASMRERFEAQLERLLERLELDTRIDMREALGALSLIDRYLAREKDDDSDSGSAIRKFEGAFVKAADGAGRGGPHRGPTIEHEPGGYDQGGNGADRGPAASSDDSGGDQEGDEPAADEDEPDPPSPAAAA